jgi:hypothetical protein
MDIKNYYCFNNLEKLHLWRCTCEILSVIKSDIISELNFQESEYIDEDFISRQKFLESFSCYNLKKSENSMLFEILQDKLTENNSSLSCLKIQDEHITANEFESIIIAAIKSKSLLIFHIDPDNTKFRYKIDSMKLEILPDNKNLTELVFAFET